MHLMQKSAKTVRVSWMEKNSFIHVNELGHRGENENDQTSKR